MYYKEAHETLKHAKDLKMETCCKVKKRNFRPSIRQRRRGAKKVWKAKTGEIRALNGNYTRGSKRIPLNCTSHGSSADVNTPVKNRSSPVYFGEGDSRRETDIESLPFDILVQIICCFLHEELKPLSYVSTKFKAAVAIARQMHFDFSTPVRVRSNKRRASSLMPDESSENYATTFEGLECLYSSPKTPSTPNAPKQVGKFQKTQIFPEDMKEISKLLFSPGTPAKDHVATLPNLTQFWRPGGVMTNRVLFVEDELCEAVARNRL
ncbi:hypothetical protein KI387_034306 [Taxus chinensis]|uniref:F-box protein n=1 Tax=Taxus chinensis TaxID=29808 RepID=A0AA38C315_TAXCH|nr:hypothetical protein KI387_034306 [Taxus chinensis]